MTIYPTNILQEKSTKKNTIEITSISKKYSFLKKNIDDKTARDLWALKDVSLDVSRGEILGLIGRNGAGKTTLLNIIGGVLAPTDGKITINRKIMGLFNLGVGFQDELTGKENIFLNGTIMGATRKELNDNLQAIIDFSELGDFINMPLGSYSQGMRLRLGFSIVANLDFDILLMDEVLAVGDALFQHKCYEQLMNFKRQGKTLVITTQSMELIERLCDRAVLLDHGRLLYQGDPLDVINRYRSVLNTEKFFVGPAHKELNIIEDTKKWGDVSDWGKRLGTKEAVIKSVDFINRFGQRCKSVRTRDLLKIRVSFIVKNCIKEPHFGVAIFREDGVYCYGPNTAFDDYSISELSCGKGCFVLTYQSLLLAPGKYRLSIAIWDKNETIAFDYCVGCYKLTVTGYDNKNNQLLNMPHRFKHKGLINKLKREPDLSCDNWINKVLGRDIKIGSLKMLDFDNKEKDIFMTNEFARFLVGFNSIGDLDGDLYLWLGIYRDDGVYCQGINAPLWKDRNTQISLPKLALLPGKYKVSLGIWKTMDQKFIICFRNAYQFKMISTQKDHGTVYLEHKWNRRSWK